MPSLDLPLSIKQISTKTLINYPLFSPSGRISFVYLNWKAVSQKRQASLGTIVQGIPENMPEIWSDALRKTAVLLKPFVFGYARSRCLSLDVNFASQQYNS